MSTTATTAQHLRTIATTWPDLRDALGAPTTISGLGLGLRGYLAAIERYDHEEAAALRQLERDPAQIGERPIPIRLRVHETMRTVEAALIETADQIASAVQRPVMSLLPNGYPEVDRRRRELLVLQDRNDPRRWRWTGTRPHAPYTALWLLARIQGAPGPFRPLSDAHRQHIARVAAGAADRIERTLDIGAETATLAASCACGGTIQVHGGAGSRPVAHCTGPCGRTWHTPEPAAA